MDYWDSEAECWELESMGWQWLGQRWRGQWNWGRQWRSGCGLRLLFGLFVFVLDKIESHCAVLVWQARASGQQGS